MPQQTTDNRPTVETLAVGDHVSDNTGVHQVVHVLRYSNGDGTPMIALTQLPLGRGEPWVARHPEGTRLHLATDAEVREYTDAAQRAALAEALHSLADDIIEQRLPLPVHNVYFSAGVLGSRADLDRWAAYLGAEVRGGTADDPIPGVDGERPVAGRMVLTIHAQTPSEPKPQPAPATATDAQVGA
jgi:hypothetical protein